MPVEKYYKPVDKPPYYVLICGKSVSLNPSKSHTYVSLNPSRSCDYVSLNVLRSCDYVSLNPSRSCDLTEQAITTLRKCQPPAHQKSQYHTSKISEMLINMERKIDNIPLLFYNYTVPLTGQIHVSRLSPGTEAALSNHPGSRGDG